MNASWGDDDARRGKAYAYRDVYDAGRDINIINRPVTKIREDEERLAALVFGQAQEKRSRLIGTDVPGDDTANIEYVQGSGRLREADGRDVGNLRSILEYYQSLSPRRLVILGAPGTGKTVLLLELQIRLLEERLRHPKAPIPVFVSASCFDTAKKWKDWLADQISLEFQLGKQSAMALVSEGRILPLVDGLDEMDPAKGRISERAQALVRALNASMRGLERAPVVLTCRPDEYGRLAEGIDKARHVELSGLTGMEMSAYLRKQFRTPGERDRWKPVLNMLERDPNGPLAAELATPWKLTQALTTFRGGGHHPAQLLPLEGVTGSDYSAYVENLLFNGYVPSAVLLNREGTPYTYPKVRRWLTSLADDLARQSSYGWSATDINLEEWKRRPRERFVAQIPFAVLLLLPFLVASVVGASMKHGELIIQSAWTSVFILGKNGVFFPGEPVSRKTSNQKKFTPLLGVGLANGIAIGLVVGVGYAIIHGRWYGLIYGLMYAIMYGCANAFTDLISDMLQGRVKDGLVRDISLGFAYGITYAIAGSLASSISYSLVSVRLLVFMHYSGQEFWSGFESEIMFGVVNGLALGLGGALSRILVGKIVDLLKRGLARKVSIFSRGAPSPRRVIRDNGLAGIAFGLAFGLVYGIISGPAQGIVVGVTAWLSLSAQIWIRYHISVIWNALRGRGPLRFGNFLGWAVRAGLLREAGISYQFRHRQLQDWLTSGSVDFGQSGVA
ncbi:MAG: NACHT domain-containing protein [Streptosporangiales bacterium]|nr:NACHT domain-containing protein [Streptosporangiales bacterium]